MNVENKFVKLFWIAFGINALFYALNIFFLLNNEIVINNGWQHYSTLQTCLFNFALALFFVSFWLFAKIKSDKRYSKFNLYLLSLVIGFVALMQVLILDILFYTLNFLSSRKLVVNGNGDNNISTFFQFSFLTIASMFLTIFISSKIFKLKFERNFKINKIWKNR